MEYTILMNKYKQLTCTNKINLYQRENLCDKVKFVIPIQYGEFNLMDFTVSVQWLDPTNVAHNEILVKSEEIYKEEYFTCTLPVDTEFSKYVGDISMKLTFTLNDYDIGKSYVLKTDEIVVPIIHINDYYASIDAQSLAFVESAITQLDARIDELDALAEIYDEAKADNIGINDNGEVQLKSNGSYIGDPINVAIPEQEDDDDDSADGIIDLSNLVIESI